MKATTWNKKNIIICFMMSFGFTSISFSQCNNSSSYGSGTAPTGGGTTTLTTCAYAGEYSPISGVAAATNYQSTSSITTDFITIRQGTSGGPVIAFGTTPLSWTSTVAGTYYAHVNTNSSCGTVSSCRTTTVTHIMPSPDDPCSAQTLIVGCGGRRLQGDNTGLTNSGVGSPACGAYAGGDVWYVLTVPASGDLQVEAYELGLSDMAMAIYSTSGGCSGSFTELACDDDSGFGNMPKIVLNGLTPGNTLYVKIWDKNNNQSGTFQIDAVDLNSNYCVTGNGTDQGNGCAQLTSASNNQLGSIWDADDKLDFTSDWTYDFVVNLGSNDGGADGICFVMQNDPAGLSASGTSGGAMGAGGISKSLIVEIDTYLNTEDRNDGITGVLCSGGPDPDHLDIWLNGDVNPGSSSGCPGIGGTRYIPNAVALTSGGSNYNIENGLNHTLRVSYVTATQTFTATIMNASATVSYGSVSYSPLNPMTLFGTNAPYFGFTGSTGGLNNQQSACLAPAFVLPVSLGEFSANCEHKTTLLSWTTLTEINNDFFTIQRSVDAVNWENLASINGSGNSSSSINYDWVDDNPLGTTAYYRLKQTDFNGDFTFSEVITVAPCASLGSVNLYPNPANGNLYATLTDIHEQLLIEIYNPEGRQVLAQQVEASSNHVVLDVSGLSEGIYFVNFKSASYQSTQKLAVTH